MIVDLAHHSTEHFSCRQRKLRWLPRAWAEAPHGLSEQCGAEGCLAEPMLVRAAPLSKSGRRAGAPLWARHVLRVECAREFDGRNSLGRITSSIVVKRRGVSTQPRPKAADTSPSLHHGPNAGDSRDRALPIDSRDRGGLYVLCGNFLNIAELKPRRIDFRRASPQHCGSSRQRSVFTLGEGSIMRSAHQHEDIGPIRHANMGHMSFVITWIWVMGMSETAM
jgi:hypothetical protein